MDETSVQDAVIIPEAIPSTATEPLKVETFPANSEVKALLTQARQVKEMIENFKCACEGSMVSGHVAVRMAIGIQWLDSMLRQNKNDIQVLQEKLK